MVMGTKRIHKGKLVRDNIPQIMRKQGLVVHEHVKDQNEFILSLKEKLLEEALEVKNTLSESELIEELADVFEVLHALVKSNGLTLQQIEEARIHKREIKGGFDARMYVESIEIDDNHPLIHRYIKPKTESN